MRRRLRAPVNARTMALVVLGLSLLVGRAMAQLGGVGGGTFGGGAVGTPILFPDGAVGSPSMSFTNSPTSGFYRVSADVGGWSSGGSLKMQFGSNLQIGPNTLYGGTTPGAFTTALSYTADNVWRADSAGGGTASWIQQSAARSFLAADYTNATTTFSNTALSITVKTGRKYSFESALFVADSTAADGSKLDFNGGSATSTNFVATCILSNAVGATLTQAAATTVALATPLNIAALTDTAVHQYVCNGSFEPSGNGTFIIRGAQNAHTTGTLTIKRGSYLNLEDMP